MVTGYGLGLLGLLWFQTRGMTPHTPETFYEYSYDTPEIINFIFELLDSSRVGVLVMVMARVMVRVRVGVVM
jgi:hypothetical protein